MPEKLDLIDLKFGKLTVLSFDSIRNRDSYWKCICDCGAETVVVRGSHLTSGHTTSCGCYQKKRAHEANFKDLINQVFGRLTVLSFDSVRKGGYYWKCLCTCGNKTVVPSNHLISGHTTSCGCYNAEKKKERCGINSPMWLGGISFEPYCPLWTKELRQRIRFFFNNECVLCGKTTEENKKKLHCHHITYEKSTCCDGKPVHFAALCPSCHAKTNYERERWESMLHRIIEEIYDGKSYYTKEEYKNIHPKTLLTIENKQDNREE